MNETSSRLRLIIWIIILIVAAGAFLLYLDLQQRTVVSQHVIPTTNQNMTAVTTNSKFDPSPSKYVKVKSRGHDFQVTLNFNPECACASHV